MNNLFEYLSSNSDYSDQLTCQCHILICTDTETFDGSKESALNVASARLKVKAWPLFRGTRNRAALQPGNTCLIYLAGKKDLAQHIFAIAEVSGKRDAKRQFKSIDSEDLLVNSPDQVLEFGQVDLVAPIPIRTFHGVLSFMNSSKWGAAFQGGCRKLSEEDAQILSAHISRKISTEFQ